MIIDLTGRQALVTGGSKGIGQAIAKELLAANARVTTVARSESGSLGENHQHLTCDFSRPDQALDSLEEFVEKNPVDILINNTGGPKPGQIIDAKWEDFSGALQMHLQMSHNLVQMVIPHMKNQNYGRIINVISTSVKMPIPGLGVSNTTRGAMASWSKTLSFELAPFGITVNNILPGFIATTRLDAIIEAKSKSQEMTTDQVAEQLKSWVPAGRFGKPEEMAHVAVFLASEQAAYVNGTNIQIDGGRTAAL